MINSKKIKSATIWSIIETTVSVVLGLLTILFLARLLSPEDYGKIATAQIISSLVQIFLNLGLNETLIQRKELTEKDIRTFWSLSIILASIAFTTCLIISYIFYALDKEIISYILIFEGITTFFIILVIVPSALLYKTLQIKKITIRNLVSRVIFFIVAIPLAIKDYGLWSIVFATVMQSSLFFYLIFKTAHIKQPLRLFINKKILKESFNFSFFVMLENLLWSVLSRVLGVLIAIFHGNYALGLYNMASRLTDTILSILNMSITRLTLPIFSSVQDNPKKLLKAFQKATFYFNLLSMPAFFTMAFTAKYWVTLLLGDSWIEIIPIVQIISVMYGVMYSRIFVGNVIKALGKSKEFLYLSLTAAIITVSAILLTRNHTLIVSLLALSIPRILITIPLGITLMKKISGFSTIEQLSPLIYPIGITLIIGTSLILLQFFSMDISWGIFLLQITIALLLFFSFTYIYYKKSNNYFKV